MNENLFTTLKQITAQHGVLILNDTKRLNGLLSDLAPTEPKSEKKALVICLMNGFHTELQNTKEDRQLCKNRLAQKLHGDEGLDLTLCNNTLDLLEVVLFGTATVTAQPMPAQQPATQPVPALQVPQPVLAPPPVQGGIIYCAQCGTQLPAGSVFCSNCGSSVQQKPPTTSTPQATPISIPTPPKKYIGRNVLIIAGVVAAVVLAIILVRYYQAKEYWEEGITQYYAKNDDKAIEAFTKAIAINSNYAAAYINRGIVYTEMKEYAKAIADLNKAININQLYKSNYYNRDIYKRHQANVVVSVYFYRGKTYHSSKDYDQALSDYTEAIRINQNDIYTYNGRGNVYRNKKQYDLAFADYNRAIQIDPNYAMAYINRGNVYWDKKQYDLAFADYNHAIQIHPDYAIAYSNRGNAYNDKKQYDLAIADYSRAIQIDPDYAIAYKGRGIAYQHKGQHGLAIVDYEKVLQLDPLNPDFEDVKQTLRFFGR
jgi:tetratricopeptide (TPR) repeat protein